MADINFGDSKIVQGGIKKTDFITQLTTKGLDKTAAGSIFDRFDTNKEGSSKDVLDKREQIGFLAFLKKLAGADKTITSDEFTQSGEKDFTEDSLSGTVSAYQEMTKNGESVSYDENGQITTGDKNYTFDEENSITEIKSGEITQTKKVKYPLVHLQANWRDQRDIGNKIHNGDEEYAEIKEMTTADEVLDKIIKLQGLEVSEDQKTELRKLLIKYNPSIFNRDNGHVWVDANWTKLDFPQGTDVAKMIKPESVDEQTPAEPVEEEIPVEPVEEENPAATNVPKDGTKPQMNATVQEWNSNYTSTYQTIGIKYAGGNYISLEGGTATTLDADAILHLDGARYTIKRKDGWIHTTVDYYNITGQRTIGQQSEQHMIGSDGYFDPNSSALHNHTEEVYLDSHGTNTGGSEFDGCPIKSLRDQGGTWRVVIKKNNVYYDMNKLLDGKKEIVIPGTFLEQGRSL